MIDCIKSIQCARFQLKWKQIYLCLVGQILEFAQLRPTETLKFLTFILYELK